MYTPKTFGVQLKEKVKNKISVEQIGSWSHSMYMQHIEDIDLEFRRLLLDLTTMELGYQFAYTYEELDKIADDLIAGKMVKL